MDERKPIGLYDPADEHDACGVGMVASIKGERSRYVVQTALDALKSMWHRGAVDADGKTGDGAGIHIQIPQSFFAEYLNEFGRAFTSDARFAVGMIFLPRKDYASQEECRTIIETEILRMGFKILGWRKVPINPEVIGDKAKVSLPEIAQILISGKSHQEEEAFERELYVVRRRIEAELENRSIKYCYICSFSCRTIIYKGLFLAEQLDAFYPDLKNEKFISAFAIFHQRFSTNTAPQWQLAQPFRVLAHNGEINTLRGNINWMMSHEATMAADVFGPYMEDLKHVVPPNVSDTAVLDAVMELIVRAGKPAPAAKLMLIPPAWSHDGKIPREHKALFGYYNCVMSPWDGPAAIVATDGRWAIAGMDRNGLRPMRYYITENGYLLLGSEAGMVPTHNLEVVEKGRLGPGEIIGIDLRRGQLLRDQEIKNEIAATHPYQDWQKNIIRLEALKSVKHKRMRAPMHGVLLRRRHLAAGITLEDLDTVLTPMVTDAKEAVGSMGDDTPLAVLSQHYRGLHHFFRQNFSQVTNPPIDSLREWRVMSLNTRIGNKENILTEDALQTHHILLDTPLLLTEELERIVDFHKKKVEILDCTFAADGTPNALRDAIENLRAQAEEAFEEGKSEFVITDEFVDADRVAIPMILAVGAIHNHMVRKGWRKRVSLLVRSAECMDAHHFAVLIGNGATVVNPFGAEATILERIAQGIYKNISAEKALENFKYAMSQGLLKIMSKMGISVVSSYRGGRNFEAIGLSRALVAEFFPGLNSRVSGIGMEGIQKRVLALHKKAWASETPEPLSVGGFYKYRARGETHALDGELIHILQTACAEGKRSLYQKYRDGMHALPPVNLRDLMDFRDSGKAISVEQVESVTEIRKRFIAPAMSLGALSPEAHETLAIAMNRIGAASNSGEGGEGRERYLPRANGDNPNSTIKQIASARFGVTAEYLNACSEIQIKIAQGAKPGEGGQLPGFKVTAEIARLRHATEGVMLISPPPHHDIYSIEDLAQLIYDLKQINPYAIVSVKLVAQSGIGTVASGVAKAMADKIVISGHVGGTGASPYTSIKHAGVPWELGLAEANQVLTLNRLRHRVTLQTDGGLRTGRDIVIAAMLGAEQYAIGTLSLVAMGCILVRQCHSNTCPVGICTQDPKLRAKFEGSVDKVINLLTFIAEDVREILAKLGAKSLNEIIGRVDLLRQVSRGSADLDSLDLSAILAKPDESEYPRYCTIKGRNEVRETLDAQMIEDAKFALENGERIELAYNVHNTHRSIGARLSSLIVRKYGTREYQHGHITVKLRGAAGQSLGAFLAKGIKLEVIGDANDYVGKGLSGGTIIVRPKPSSTLETQKNTIIGNTVLYGATSGFLYAAGQAGERFAVRNSGAYAVVEGCGSNGCEYMTSGHIVILGKVGNNFAAGMTGGMAFIYDPEEDFTDRINAETVVFQRIEMKHWEAICHDLIEHHARETSSLFAKNILMRWEDEKHKFWQVCPKEMLNRLQHPISKNKLKAA